MPSRNNSNSKPCLESLFSVMMPHADDDDEADNFRRILQSNPYWTSLDRVNAVGIKARSGFTLLPLRERLSRSKRSSSIQEVNRKRRHVWQTYERSIAAHGRSAISGLQMILFAIERRQISSDDPPLRQFQLPVVLGTIPAIVVVVDECWFCNLGEPACQSKRLAHTNRISR